MPLNNIVLLTCERHAGAHGHQRVVATGEVDLATGPRLADALRAAQADARDVVLDLEGTTFMDMGGVRILLAAAEHARTAAGTFEIVHATTPVTRMLALTGADRALEGRTTASPQRRERVTAREPATPLPARTTAVPRSLHIPTSGPRMTGARSGVTPARSSVENGAAGLRD